MVTADEFIEVWSVDDMALSPGYELIEVVVTGRDGLVGGLGETSAGKRFDAQELGDLIEKAFGVGSDLVKVADKDLGGLEDFINGGEMQAVGDVVEKKLGLEDGLGDGGGDAA